MKRYKWVVLTKPVEGREDEYNNWYQNEHLGHIVDVPGVLSGQRYKLSLGLRPESYPYMAIYEIETDNLEKVIGELKARANTPRLPLSDASDDMYYSAIYDEFGAEVVAE